MLFTDEITFSCKGVNAHNSHVWVTSSPHAMQVHVYQQRFCVNVWTDNVNDFLIGPYLLPMRLNGQSYLIFLEHMLPELPPELRSPFINSL